MADNQRAAAAAMAQAGAALVVDRQSADFANDFDLALTRLVTDADVRTALAVRAARICDGEGAGPGGRRSAGPGPVALTATYRLRKSHQLVSSITVVRRQKKP